MLCIISFIFIFLVVAQLEAGSISIVQALLFGIYGLIVCNYTSKPYSRQYKKANHHIHK